MIDLYALTSPNVQKIFVMLEECELPYNTKLVDVWKGDQFGAEFSRINPLQKIPAIVDSDGPGGTPYLFASAGGERTLAVPYLPPDGHGLCPLWPAPIRVPRLRANTLPLRYRASLWPFLVAAAAASWDDAATSDVGSPSATS